MPALARLGLGPADPAEAVAPVPMDDAPRIGQERPLGLRHERAHPAQIFMGDTGSLALGGIFGTLAVMSKQELLLAVVGGVFVIEVLSVIIQVVSFRLTGKRVFRMAPLHHHFELKGWAEPQVITRFWIIGLVLMLVALSTFKLR